MRKLDAMKALLQMVRTIRTRKGTPEDIAEDRTRAENEIIYRYHLLFPGRIFCDLETSVDMMADEVTLLRLKNQGLAESLADVQAELDKERGRGYGQRVERIRGAYIEFLEQVGEVTKSKDSAPEALLTSIMALTQDALMTLAMGAAAPATEQRSQNVSAKINGNDSHQEGQT